VCHLTSIDDAWGYSYVSSSMVLPRSMWSQIVLLRHAHAGDDMRDSGSLLAVELPVAGNAGSVEPKHSAAQLRVQESDLTR
jgi:hypothetical protein